MRRTRETTKYYLYAGFWELWVSKKILGAPLTPISWHKSLAAAKKAAKKYDDYAKVIYDVELSEEVYNDLEEIETKWNFANMSKYGVNRRVGL